MPEFPAIPELESKGDFTAGYNQADPYVIDRSGAYNSITVTNKLTIDVGDEDIVLVTNNLSVKGSGKLTVNRTGTGKLILYVLDTLELANSGSINKDGDCHSVEIYYAGSNELNITGNAKLHGSIFAKDANIAISGSAGITGNIVTSGSTVALNGNTQAKSGAVYAPNANLIISGSSKLTGIAVVQSIKLSGSTSIIQDNSIGFDFLEQLAW